MPCNMLAVSQTVVNMDMDAFSAEDIAEGASEKLNMPILTCRQDVIVLDGVLPNGVYGTVEINPRKGKIFIGAPGIFDINPVAETVRSRVDEVLDVLRAERTGQEAKTIVLALKAKGIQANMKSITPKAIVLEARIGAVVATISLGLDGSRAVAVRRGGGVTFEQAAPAVASIVDTIEGLGIGEWPPIIEEHTHGADAQRTYTRTRSTNHTKAQNKLARLRSKLTH